MKKLDYYMNLNYPIEIQKIPEDQGGGYQACIPLLGKYAFLGDGETVEEALENLNETKEYLFNRYLERGIKIPEPVTEEEKEYSGRFVLRIPNELHRSLALEAKKNDSTLNQFCLYLLTRKSYLNTIQEEVKLIHQQVTDIFNHIKEISYDVEQLSWPQHEKCANVVDMNHYEYPQMRMRTAMPNISPEHYRKTLETIELLNISCIKMSAHISHELLTPQMNISIRDQASFENIDQGFKVENKYTLTSKNNEKKTAIKIECVYLITFKSSKDIDEDFFDIYKTHSLPLNVWPFFREYVNSLTSRMNIQPLTLPLMKR